MGQFSHEFRKNSGIFRKNSGKFPGQNLKIPERFQKNSGIFRNNSGIAPKTSVNNMSCSELRNNSGNIPEYSRIIPESLLKFCSKLFIWFYLPWVSSSGAVSCTPCTPLHAFEKENNNFTLDTITHSVSSTKIFTELLLEKGFVTSF